MFVTVDLDGDAHELDLSVPGTWGDFAFSSTRLTTGRTRYFRCYHTYEASVFVQVLHAMSIDRPGASTLIDLDRLRADVRERTTGVAAATEVSEDSFESYLPDLAQPGPGATGTYRADSSGDRRFLVTGSSTGVAFKMTGDPDRPEQTLVVLQTELWRVAAGMVWRSYSERETRAPLLTRLSTATYESALRAYERGLRERSIT